MSSDADHSATGVTSIPTNFPTPFLDAPLPSPISSYENNNGNSLPPTLFHSHVGTFAHPPTNSDKLVVAVLISLMAILCIILGFITIPPLINIIRRKMPVPKARIERRYATIDSWLITKRVQAHDEACESIQKRYGSSPPTIRATGASELSPSTNPNDSQCEPASQSSTTDSSSSSCSSYEKSADLDGNNEAAEAEAEGRSTQQSKTNNNTLRTTTGTTTTKKRPTVTVDNLLQKLEPVPLGDTASQGGSEDNTDDDVESLLECGGQRLDDDDVDSLEVPSCPICLEAFRVGDKVSWSSNRTCEHVFHHACIREWLLKRTACPCCRVVVLAVDRPLEALDESHVEQDGGVGARRGGHNNENGSNEEIADRRARTYPGGSRRRLTVAEMKVFSAERTHRMATTYYCVEDGLVTLYGCEWTEDPEKPCKKRNTRTTSLPKFGKFWSTTTTATTTKTRSDPSTANTRDTSKASLATSSSSSLPSHPECRSSSMQRIHTSGTTSTTPSVASSSSSTSSTVATARVPFQEEGILRESGMMSESHTEDEEEEVSSSSCSTIGQDDHGHLEKVMDLEEGVPRVHSDETIELVFQGPKDDALENESEDAKEGSWFIEEGPPLELEDQQGSQLVV